MVGEVRRWSVTGLALLGLVGCRDNPYPDGQFTAQKQPRVQVQKIYSIQAPAVVRFSEGVEGSFSVKGIVPPPGTAIITVSNLPAGAVFSPDENKVSWKPGYEAANDPKDPTVMTKDYQMTISLRSSTDPKTIEEQVVTLIVQDTPRSFRLVDFNSSWGMSEGIPYSVPMIIEDEDAPKGPFNISVTDAPAGVTILSDKVDPRRFIIQFTPGYDLVDSNYIVSQKSQIKDFNWKLFVSDPKGKVITAPVVFRVSDTRQLPVYFGPNQISVKSTDINFVFTASDGNFETEPQITVDPVSFGQVTVTRLSGINSGVPGVQPSQSVHVHWSDVPPEQAGKSADLHFKMCVFDVDRTLSNCAEQVVTVNFNFAPPPPPPAPTPFPMPSPISTPEPSPTPGPTPVSTATPAPTSMTTSKSLQGGRI